MHSAIRPHPTAILMLAFMAFVLSGPAWAGDEAASRAAQPAPAPAAQPATAASSAAQPAPAPAVQPAPAPVYPAALTPQQEETLRQKRKAGGIVGLLVGGAVGGIAGAAIGNATWEAPAPCDAPTGCVLLDAAAHAARVRAFGIGGLVVGGGLGTLIGITGAESRYRASLQKPVSVHVAPVLLPNDDPDRPQVPGLLLSGRF